MLFLPEGAGFSPHRTIGYIYYVRAKARTHMFKKKQQQYVGPGFSPDKTIGLIYYC
jgi:hypothetical protein